MIDEHNYTLACAESLKSPDPIRKVGCVICNKVGVVISTGFNRPIVDLTLIEVRDAYARPQKYYLLEHAERDAIFNAVKNEQNLVESCLYVNSFPCADCARAIIQAGVRRLVVPQPEFDHPRWGEHQKYSFSMMNAAQIELVYVDSYSTH